MTRDDTERDSEPQAGPGSDATEGAPAQPTEAAAPVPEPEPQPTLLEIQRRLVASTQPAPWRPSDPELDPESETGWETAAQHELRAIREEDLASLPPLPVNVGPLVPPAPAFNADAAAPVAFPAFDGTAPSNVIEFAQPTALAPTERRWRRRARGAKAGLEAAARPLLLVALFGFGVSLGWWTWVRNLPPPQVAQPQVAATGTTDDVPTQVQSLVAALNSDNQTQLQVVVPAEPYRLLAGEMTRRGVARIVGARAFGTYTAGDDSATEILIGGANTAGDPVVFNLVVHLHAGEIADFR